MAGVYRLDYSRLGKFEWPVELVSELVVRLGEPSFAGIDLDLPDLTIYCSQKNIVYLGDLCQFYEDLVGAIGLEESSVQRLFLKIPLWEANASGHHSRFEVTHFKGKPFLRVNSNAYDPQIIIAEKYKGSSTASKSIYFSTPKTSVREMVEVEVEEFSPPSKEALHAFTNSYFLFESLSA